jgi:DNA-binding transcriptional ArsR family regulator
MAHAPYLREKARQMRVERKLTIDELAERLALSRSTVYYWVKDLPIEGSGSGGPFPTHGQRMGNRAMQLKYKRLRDAAYEEGRQAFDELATDPTFRDFVCLYLAEGYKRDRNCVAICNSDPAVMVLRYGGYGASRETHLSTTLPTTPIKTSTRCGDSGRMHLDLHQTTLAVAESRIAGSLPDEPGVAVTVC